MGKVAVKSVSKPKNKHLSASANPSRKIELPVKLPFINGKGPLKLHPLPTLVDRKGVKIPLLEIDFDNGKGPLNIPLRPVFANGKGPLKIPSRPRFVNGKGPLKIKKIPITKESNEPVAEDEN